MSGFSVVDYLALAFFALAWIAYYAAVERSRAGGRSLNSHMNHYRYEWMEQMVMRENRIVDTTIMASLQNGTAFFASTSLIAIGGVVTLFKSSEDVVSLFSQVPGLATTLLAWELKVAGLAVIFIYAFFKFAWAYRLFNYVAILVGSVPVLRADNHDDALTAARRAARMNVVAGQHFNQGQRAFFFALAYLGWFASAYVFIATTGAVLYVMWRRQFASDARSALLKQE